jgi:hypothetical protein
LEFQWVDLLADELVAAKDELKDMQSVESSVVTLVEKWDIDWVQKLVKWLAGL